MWKTIVISYLITVSASLAGPHTARKYLPVVGPAALRFELPAPPMVVMNLPPLDMGRDGAKSSGSTNDTASSLAQGQALDGQNTLLGPPLPPDWLSSQSVPRPEQNFPPSEPVTPPIYEIIKILSGTNNVIVTTPVSFTPPTPAPPPPPAIKSSSAVYTSPPAKP